MLRELSSQGCIDGRSLQVRHVGDADAQIMQLPCSLHRPPNSTMKCRWDPNGRYLVVLSTRHDYDRGSARIWDTITGGPVHSCRMNSDPYWPQWRQQHPPRRSRPEHELASPISSMSGSLRQCLVHESAGLLFGHDSLLTTQDHESASLSSFGQGEPSKPSSSRLGYGFCWSHMSPNGSLVTSLLADTEDEPGCGVGPHQNEHAFRHYRTASGNGCDVLLPKDGCLHFQNGSKQKSHPFLCTWLPGTTIYAADALGWVYVCDGMTISSSRCGLPMPMKQLLQLLVTALLLQDMRLSTDLKSQDFHGHLKAYILPGSGHLTCSCTLSVLLRSHSKIPWGR